MNEFRTLPELEMDLIKLRQALENEDITPEAFKAGAIDLKKRIKALKLAIAKQNKKNEIRALRISGKIQGLAYVSAMFEIENAQNEDELPFFNPQN